jgi:hypothetical protein
MMAVSFLKLVSSAMIHFRFTNQLTIAGGFIKKNLKSFLGLLTKMKYKPGQKVVCIKKPDWLFDSGDERMGNPGRLPHKEAITLFKIYEIGPICSDSAHTVAIKRTDTLKIGTDNHCWYFPEKVFSEIFALVDRK